MKCPYCGEYIDSADTICVHCGGKINNELYRVSKFAVFSFIISLFIPIVGFICSIISYKRFKTYNSMNKGLSIAGLVISSLYLLPAAYLLLMTLKTLFMILLR